MRTFNFRSNLLAQILISLMMFVSLEVVANAQYATRIVPRATAPAQCSPGNGDVYYNTTTDTLMSCTAANTWSPAGQAAGDVLTLVDLIVSDQITSTQGAITVSAPAFTSTSTWNAGAVTFTHLFANVIDTASAAGSLLADLQVGGVSQFSVSKGGDIVVLGSISLGAAESLLFTGQGGFASSADGEFSLTNTAGTGITHLALGPESIAGVGLVPDVVAGQQQGIIITNGNGSGFSQAELAAATNGAVVYCDDCTKATPCAGGGTGALAKRYNGAWDCD